MWGGAAAVALLAAVLALQAAVPADAFNPRKDAGHREYIMFAAARHAAKECNYLGYSNFTAPKIVKKVEQNLAVKYEKQIDQQTKRFCKDVDPETGLYQDPTIMALLGMPKLDPNAPATGVLAEVQAEIEERHAEAESAGEGDARQGVAVVSEEAEKDVSAAMVIVIGIGILGGTGVAYIRSSMGEGQSGQLTPAQQAAKQLPYARRLPS